MIRFLIACGLVVGLSGCRNSEFNGEEYRNCKAFVIVHFSDGGESYFDDIDISTSGIIKIGKPLRITYKKEFERWIKQ